MTEVAAASERILKLRADIEQRKRRQKRVRLLGGVLLLGALGACGAVCVSWLTGDASFTSNSVYTGWGAVALGDVDGDGVADFALNSRFDPTSGDDSPSTWVISGKSARPLYVLQLDLPTNRGASVTNWVRATSLCFADLGDLDRDGGSDFAVGLDAESWNSGPRGAVRALSGRSGALLWDKYGEARGQRLGHSLVSVGDLDADGVADLLLGVREEARRIHPASVELRSGLDARLIARIEGPRLENAGWSRSETLFEVHFGNGLCALGDVDADGVPDFAVGAPLGYDSSTDSFRAVGAVFAFSGRTQHLLWSRSGREWGSLGTVLLPFGDRDGDGCADLLTSEYGESCKTLSGGDGSVLEQHTGWRELIPLGDLDADGEAEAIGRFQGQNSLVALLSGRELAQSFRLDVAEGFHSFAARDAFGSLGDLDGDGVREIFAVSDRALDQEHFDWVADFGALTIHSGRDGAVLRHITRETLREAALAGCPVVVSRVGR
jgi:hypothetical protein